MGVQLEDGYTKIANEILKQLARIKLNGTQYKILLVVLRYTYGFNRKQHELSRSFLAKATCTDKDRVGKEINKLIKMKILTVQKEATFSASRIIGFNKYFEQWEGWEPEKEEEKTTPVCEKDHSPKNTPVGESAHTPVCELAYSPVCESAHQEIKLKEKLNKDIVVVTHTREEKQELDIYSYYTHCGFGTISGIMKEKLDDLIDHYSEHWLRLALEESANQAAFKLAYVTSILQRWKSSGGPDPPKTRGRKGANTSEKKTTAEEFLARRRERKDDG